jgi:hypothetical protein
MLHKSIASSRQELLKHADDSRWSVRAIPTHKHAIQTPVLVGISCEAGFVKRRTVVDDQ